jgi:MoCo/4Fe-4S cofactor protein with predicted Tat translocation signal
MKTPTKTLPEPAAASPYWRSIAELESSPEVQAHLEHKVPDHQELFGDATSRRGFLQVMGASLAFAGVAGAGCRWEEDHIVPMAERPEGWVPGVPKKYATAMEVGGVGTALIATSYDGRPIKLDGNAEAGSPGSSAFTQAAILGMYDPDRSRAVVRRAGGKPTAGGWAEFEDLVAKKVAAGGGAGLRFLAEPTSSPTLLALREAVRARLPEARWHEYEPLSRDNELVGTRMAFGAPHRVHYKLAGANVIAAFDCDLFFEHPDAVALGRAFGARRDPDAGAMPITACRSVPSWSSRSCSRSRRRSAAAPRSTRRSSPSRRSPSSSPSWPRTSPPTAAPRWSASARASRPTSTRSRPGSTPRSATPARRWPTARRRIVRPTARISPRWSAT